MLTISKIILSIRNFKYLIFNMINIFIFKIIKKIKIELTQNCEEVMKLKIKYIGIIFLIGLFTNAICASATVGVEVGDTFTFKTEVKLTIDQNDYNMSYQSKIKVTEISDPTEILDMSVITITYDLTMSNYEILEGDLPANEELPKKTTIESMGMIYDDAIMTNTSQMTGAYFIDASYTPKNVTGAVNASYEDLSTQLTYDVEYDSNGVLMKSEVHAMLNMSGIVTETLSKSNRIANSIGIPGYPIVFIGIVFLISIPMLYRKVKK